MKTTNLFSSLVIIANTSFINSVYAENDLYLDDTTTTARHLQKSADTSANMQIFTAKQINERGYKNLKDLLENVAGIDIQSYNAIGHYNVVSMRGALNNKLLILKDGIRISTPSGEINALGENYPLYLAKRVEIITGPATVNYGSEAFSGVINIITFDKSDKTQNNISVAAGGEHYLDTHVLYSQTFDNGVYINTGLQGYYSQEFDFAKNYPELYDDNSKKYDFKNTKSYQFFGDAQVNEHFSAGFYYSKINYSSDFSAKPNYSNFSNSYLEESISSIYSMFDYHLSENLISNTLLTYQLFTLGNDSHFNNLSTQLNKQFKYGRTARYDLKQHFIYQSNNNHLILSGLEYSYLDIIPRSADLPSPYNVEEKPNQQTIVYANTSLPIKFFQQRDEKYSVYIQDNWKLNKQWQLVSGIRYEYHTLYGSSINPNLKTTYQPNEANIFKLMYAQSNLEPSSSFAFNNFGEFTGEQNEQNEWLSNPAVSFRVPKSNLKPEKLNSIELNYQHWFTKSASIIFAPFYNRTNDTIAVSEDKVAIQAITGAYLIKTNSAKNTFDSKSYGIDITSTINTHINHDELKYWLAFSYVDGEQTNQTYKAELPMIAHYKVKTGLTYRYNDQYVISPTIRWFSETTQNSLIDGNILNQAKIDSYFVIDLHTKAQINDKFSVEITFNNILDKRYFNAPFQSSDTALEKSPQLGRLVYATMKYHF